jgi:hypothetical protein
MGWVGPWHSSASVRAAFPSGGTARVNAPRLCSQQDIPFLSDASRTCALVGLRCHRWGLQRRDAFTDALVSALVLRVPLQAFTGIDRLHKGTQGTLARRQRGGSGARLWGIEEVARTDLPKPGVQLLQIVLILF